MLDRKLIWLRIQICNYNLNACQILFTFFSRFTILHVDAMSLSDLVVIGAESEENATEAPHPTHLAEKGREKSILAQIDAKARKRESKCVCDVYFLFRRRSSSYSSSDESESSSESSSRSPSPMQNNGNCTPPMARDLIPTKLFWC